MDTLAIIILSIVQGLTEFLPVSSSGHLLVAAEICRKLGLGLPTDTVAISIVLHIGTLLSILVFYRQKIWRLIGEDRKVVPLLVIAESMQGGIIQSAGIVTVLGFGGLTLVPVITKKDFSFPRGILMWGGILALRFISAGAIFGFSGGTFFSVGMVGFAGGAILYDTSNVMHHYPTNKHVGAALQLFSSVALMFWYILRIFLASRD